MKTVIKVIMEALATVKPGSIVKTTIVPSDEVPWSYPNSLVLIDLPCKVYDSDHHKRGFVEYKDLVNALFIGGFTLADTDLVDGSLHESWIKGGFNNSANL